VQQCKLCRGVDCLGGILGVLGVLKGASPQNRDTQMVDFLVLPMILAYPLQMLMMGSYSQCAYERNSHWLGP
jgi:hypothetical protein